MENSILPPLELKRYCFPKSVSVDALAGISYFEFDDRFRDIPERHEAWELLYIDRGSCGVVADDREFTLEQGQIYLHKPFEKHWLQIAKGGCPNVFIASFFSTSPALCRIQSKPITASVAIKQHLTAIIHEASATFSSPFDQLHCRWFRLKGEDKLFAGEQTVMLRLELLLIDLLREDSTYRSPRRSVLQKDLIPDAFCQSVIGFLEDHLYEKLSLDDLSRQFSYSKSFISRHFTGSCGYSVMECFNRMKVEEAKDLIRSSERTLFEISEKLMFSNSHYFSTVFRKYTGMTPTQYRNSCK